MDVTAQNARDSIQSARARLREAEAVLQRQRGRHGRLMQNRARALGTGDLLSSARLYEEYGRAEQQLADFEEQWRQFFSRLCALPQVFLESSPLCVEGALAPLQSIGPERKGRAQGEGSLNALWHRLLRGRS